MHATATFSVQSLGLRVGKLSINYQDSPLATPEHPVFTWQLKGSGSGAQQQSFHLMLLKSAGTLIWDSGERHGNVQRFHYDGTPLTPDTDYRAILRVRHRNGEFTPWSAPADFGVGLPPACWNAQWVGRSSGGSASVGIVGENLRVAAAGTLPLPFPPAADFTLRTRFHNTMGRVRLLLRGQNDPTTGTPTGATVPIDAGAPGWHDLVVTAKGRTIEVSIDGVATTPIETPVAEEGFIAFQQGHKEQLEISSLILETDKGAQRLAFPEAGLEGWPSTTTARQIDEWTLLRGSIPLTKPVSRARLYAAGCHQYELHVNGHRAGRGGSFSYPGEGRYQTFDVTDLLRNAQEATLAFLLHWFGPGQGRAPGEPGLMAHLSITYDDGTRAGFGTGPGWQATEGPYKQSGYRNDEGDPVEHLDARNLPDGSTGAWQQCGFDDSCWPPAVVRTDHPLANAELLPQETVLVEEQLECREILRAADGTLVADFGQVLPARPVVEFLNGVAGRMIPLRAGYTLGADGRVDTNKLATQNTDMSFPYTQADGPQEYRAFTHLGFRYLEIPGVGADEVGSVGAVVVRGGHPFHGVLESSNPELNAVMKLLSDSTLYGIQEQFVDTPTREKGQFLGDAVNISYAAMSLFGDRAYTRTALLEIAASAKRYWSSDDERGRYNAVYPNGDGKRDIPDFSLQMVEWALDYHRHSGDSDLLRELYPQLRDTADYVLRHLPMDGPTAGLVTDLGGGSGPYLHGIVDWPAPGRFGYDMDAAARTTVNAQAYGVLAGVAKLASIVGMPETDAAHYESAAVTLAAVMNAKLRVSGRLVDGLHADGSSSTHASSHATSFALSLGVTEPRFWKSDAEYLASRGMAQGPMTVHRLFRALLRAGDVQSIVDLLIQEDGPGWMRILAAGGTFTWEAWDLVENTDYSQSHAWSASVLTEIVESLLGVQLVEPGAARLRLMPPSCSLTAFSGTVPTERGPVSLAWERRGTALAVAATLPAGTSAVLHVPAGRYRVASPLTHSYEAGPNIELSPGRWEISPV